MWVCLKCGRRTVEASKICRACGGIIEEENSEISSPALDAVPIIESESTTERQGTELGSNTNSPKAEVEIDPPSWVCTRCGEIVPPNFEMCWNCMTTKTGEPGPDMQIVRDVDENEPEPEPAERISSVERGAGRPLRLRCPCCQSTKLMRDVTVYDQGQPADGAVNGVVDKLAPPFWRNRVFGEILADICGECGHMELRVTNPSELYKQFILKSNPPPPRENSE